MGCAGGVGVFVAAALGVGGTVTGMTELVGAGCVGSAVGVEGIVAVAGGSDGATVGERVGRTTVGVVAGVTLGVVTCRPQAASAAATAAAERVRKRRRESLAMPGVICCIAQSLYPKSTPHRGMAPICHRRATRDRSYAIIAAHLMRRRAV